MKIIVISQNWSPEESVPQRRWDWLVRHLIDDGHEVIAVAPAPSLRGGLASGRHFLLGARADKQKEWGPAGEYIVRCKPSRSGSSLWTRSLYQLVTAGRLACVALRPACSKIEVRSTAVVGTVPAIPTLFAAFAVAKLTHSKFVIDLRDAWPELMDEMADWEREMGQGRNGYGSLATSFRVVAKCIVSNVLYRIYKSADSIIVTTEGHKHSLRLALARFNKTPPIRVVRNVFPSCTVVDCADGVERSGELRVLYAGKVGRAQQLSNAIQAVGIARDLLGVNVKMRVIGAGASLNTCKDLAAHTSGAIEFIEPISREELGREYAWADTALVHLAPWDSLSNTVPSKTYELMQLGKHITMVAGGEPAKLVTTLRAGLSVPPGDPQALAAAFSKLAADPSLMDVPSSGANWVAYQQNSVVPQVLFELFS